MTTFNFSAIYSQGTNPVTGSFTITPDLDPNHSTPNGIDQSNITLDRCNLAFPTNVFFRYIQDNSNGLLQVYFPAGLQGTGSFPGFLLRITDFKTTPKFEDLNYSLETQPGVFTTFNSTGGSVLVLNPFRLLLERLRRLLHKLFPKLFP